MKATLTNLWISCPDQRDRPLVVSGPRRPQHPFRPEHHQVTRHPVRSMQPSPSGHNALSAIRSAEGQRRLSQRRASQTDNMSKNLRRHMSFKGANLFASATTGSEDATPFTQISARSATTNPFDDLDIFSSGAGDAADDDGGRGRSTPAASMLFEARQSAAQSIPCDLTNPEPRASVVTAGDLDAMFGDMGVSDVPAAQPAPAERKRRPSAWQEAMSRSTSRRASVNPDAADRVRKDASGGATQPQQATGDWFFGVAAEDDPASFDVFADPRPSEAAAPTRSAVGRNDSFGHAFDNDDDDDGSFSSFVEEDTEDDADSRVRGRGAASMALDNRGDSGLREHGSGARRGSRHTRASTGGNVDRSPGIRIAGTLLVLERHKVRPGGVL